MKSLPNYVPDVIKLGLRLKHKRHPGEVLHVTISHDDWCSFFQGGLCDCDPEVREGLPRSQQGQ